jgi:hypothetical protein
MVVFPAEAGAFFLLQSIQRPGHEDDQTPTLSAAVGCDCTYIYNLPYVFVTCTGTLLQSKSIFHSGRN